MQFFNFTKVYKYVAGMAGLKYLSYDKRMQEINGTSYNTILRIDDIILRIKHSNFSLDDKLSAIKSKLEEIHQLSSESPLFFSQFISSLFINLFDNYVTQNFTDNKLIQYGTMAGISLICGLYNLRLIIPTFIESCILKAISDDYESKADNDIQTEVQLEGLSLSTPSDDYESKADNDIQTEVQLEGLSLSTPELLNG